MKHIKFLAIGMLCSALLFSDENAVTEEMHLSKRMENCTPQPCPIIGKSGKAEQEIGQTTSDQGYYYGMQEDDFRIQVGGNYTYAWISPSGSPTVKGSLGGADALFEYRPLNSVYAGVSFAYHQGTPKAGGTERSLLDFDTQGRIGFTASSRLYGKSRIALFTGFGGRYMGEKATAGDASVKFDYVQFYVPVGFLFENRLSYRFAWGVNAQWRPQIFPTVDIIPLDGARWILKKKINNFLVDVPLSFFVSDHFAIIVDPFYELWHDGHTTAETQTGLLLGLPGNRYTFTGVNVNLAWSF
ncbi:MAG TPA: hypothetical protein VLE95_05340 [Chlamydiales bacterium]|nr:hypothetical protein [Chlamydiales bacterium]